ncbi:CBS domain-containing protein [Paraflavisolibacter sp. H34]|uniref:CBS domain-containing protein n=1 Tax=Huijunlia imazamoxiresistens TaxID=3127457 RepID=UPI003019D953
MKKVSDILSRKGKHITAVTPGTTVIDALKIMAEENIGSIIVMEGRNFLGIMTERDYARKVVLNGKSSSATTVSEIMSTEFPPIAPRDTIEYCMQQLSERNIRYLPVFEEDRLTGIISINDVVRETITAHEETITHLKDYLHANL